MDMEGTNEILEIRDRLLNEMLFGSVFEMYQKECRTKGSGISEEDYDAARRILSGLLPEKQYACLREGESICFEIAWWLAEFAFIQGIYAGFGQHFAPDASANQFQTLVFDSVLQIPGMQRYPEYYAHREKANDCFIKSRKCVSPAAAGHVAEIELAWQNRFLGVCRFGFPLGYRFALSLINEPVPDWPIPDWPVPDRKFE